MKVAVECRSVLMQKALEKFLDKYLSSIKQCDIVIRDYPCEEKRCLHVSSQSDADLVKPFSKSQLLLALENKYKQLGANNTQEVNQNEKDFSILEKRIEMITQEYKQNILQAIKAFYG